MRISLYFSGSFTSFCSLATKFIDNLIYENIQETHFFLISKIISKLPYKILFFICKLLGWWITHNNLQQRKQKNYFCQIKKNSYIFPFHLKFFIHLNIYIIELLQKQGEYTCSQVRLKFAVLISSKRILEYKRRKRKKKSSSILKKSM